MIPHTDRTTAQVSKLIITPIHNEILEQPAYRYSK